MRTQLFSALSSALPLAVVVSPLLVGAAQATYYPIEQSPVEQSPARSPYGNNCNAEAYEAAQVINRSLVSGGREQRVDMIAQPIDASAHAIVTSEQELSIFSRERLSALTSERLYTTVRRLLLSNPYANDSMDTEQALSNCMALMDSLSDRELLIAQASDPLPVLGPVNGSAPSEPTATPPQQPPSAQPTARPAQPTARPESEPTIAPLPAPPASNSPALPTIPPANRAQPVAPTQSPASTSIDPTNITPTRVNPIPFDGAPISTLSSRPDGNYRYVTGEVEDRPYTDSELQQQGRTVVVLRKEGNRVIGELMPRLGEPGICVTGVASGDSVSGLAYLESAEDKAPATQIPTALRLQSARSTAQSSSPVSAVLDLSEFSMINAGSTLPPKSCDTVAALE